MVNVEYTKDHGNYKKGDKREMPESTAKALETHKVVKMVTSKKEDKE